MAVKKLKGFNRKNSFAVFAPDGTMDPYSFNSTKTGAIQQFCFNKGKSGVWEYWRLQGYTVKPVSVSINPKNQ